MAHTGKVKLHIRMTSEYEDYTTVEISKYHLKEVLRVLEEMNESSDSIAIQYKVEE